MNRLFMFAALCAWSLVAQASVYRWTDAQGKIQYGDRPPDGVQAELVSLLSVRSTAPASTTRSSAATAAAAKPAPTAATPGQDTDKKAVEKDVEDAKVKQCNDARERYRILIEGRHLYRAGKDGEREYLTSEEIDSQRLNAKRDIDSICNSAN